MKRVGLFLVCVLAVALLAGFGMFAGSSYAQGDAAKPAVETPKDTSTVTANEETEEVVTQEETEEVFPPVLAFEGLVEDVVIGARAIKVKNDQGQIMDFEVDKDAFIFVNEDTVELESVQKADKVYVTFVEKDGKNVADWVEVTR